MSSLLDTDGSMLGNVSSRPALLPAGRIDIRRLVDANIEEPSNKDIHCKYLLFIINYFFINIYIYLLLHYINSCKISF